MRDEDDLVLPHVTDEVGEGECSPHRGGRAGEGAGPGVELWWCWSLCCCSAAAVSYLALCWCSRAPVIEARAARLYSTGDISLLGGSALGARHWQAGPRRLGWWPHDMGHDMGRPPRKEFSRFWTLSKLPGHQRGTFFKAENVLKKSFSTIVAIICRRST